MKHEVISSDAAFIPSGYYLNEIQDFEWPLIEKSKSQVVITHKPAFDLLRFPGLVFSNNDFATEYFKLYSDLNYPEVFTPPRGNLAESNSYMFIGIKPGHYYAHQSKSEASWLFGPSVIMLFGLLTRVDIYPYFTNVYKSHYEVDDGDTTRIEAELIGIANLFEKYYSKKILNLVFMGNYAEYDKIYTALSKTRIKFNAIRIWHPAYLARNSSRERFEYWVDDFKTKARL